MINQKKLFFYLFLIINTFFLFPLDLSTSFNIGNMGFTNDVTASQQGIVWGANVIAEHQIDNQFLFTGKLNIDEVTGNRIDSRLTFIHKYFQIGLGPSLAAINNGQFQLKPAINALVSVKKDGLFHMTAEIYSTIGNLSDPLTDYSQLESSLAFGLNIPGAISTFSIANKQFTYFDRDAASTISKTTDLFSLYQLQSDIHKKNIPFHLILTLGYKSIERIYPVSDAMGRTKAGIGSAFIGLGTRINIGKKIILSAGLESGLYNFSLSDEITAADLPSFLFNAFTSVKYEF